MKQKIALGLFATLFIIVLCSNSSGYGGNRTGATGTSGCGSCHGSTTSIGTVVELDSAGVAVTSYRPGGSYTVKITATNNTGLSLPVFGCEMSVVKTANAGTTSATLAGTWGAMPSNMTAHGLYVEHNTRLNPTSGTGANGTVYSISVPWTAPAASTGSVKIYGVVNAVNNNGGDDSGDKYQNATAVIITEAVVVAPVASVTISVTSGSNTTCSGVPVTFTAVPANGGTAPTYQWKAGSTVVGTGVTFTSSTLTNGQVITCVMTSNLSGVTGSPATSNAITMAVTTSVTDSVNISATATSICPNTSVTFTAHPFNGGTPGYQWFVGATAVSTGSTYTSSALTNGNVVTCVMTPTGTCVSPATSTSNAITMVVNPTVTDSVNISASTTTVCAGTSVTFTAHPFNGGTPSYQWKVGTTVVGTGGTYTSSTLANGNVVTCVMTPTGNCVSPATSTSNAITMTVNPTVTDSVNISATATTICAGTSVTFTAHSFNGGTPSYQWKVGTTVVGTGSTYTSSALANGNVVTCVMTPTGSCVSPTTATSNAITMVVNPIVTDSVTITATATSTCPNTPVTFTAHPFNAGTPSYQWFVGTTAVGTGATYSSSALTNGNVVTCVMTPTGNCVSPATSTSNAITMSVNAAVTDSVNISASATTVCAGTSVTFTAHPFNGGTPSYQWKVGTTVVGTASTYTSSSLTNGNVVTCVMTPTGACVSPATATSNAITMTINPTVTDSVNISASATTICSGTSVTFTAHPFNGGTPGYQWKVGTTVVGTGSTYTSSALANGNVVTCVMTPTGSCVSPATSTSNAITMTVNTTGTDSINITTPATTVCSGTAVTFTAHATNGGANPAYQWKVGTTAVGTGAIYTSSSLANGSVVTCILTPSGACATPATSTSNAIKLTVNPSVTDSVTITGSANNICSGTSVTFTAHPYNGGTPSYQWFVGSGSVGTGSTYTSSTLANNNVVTCVMTPTGTCVSPATATSNPITMVVNATGTDSVSITASATSACAGSPLTFTAHPTNGGANPGYQWKVGTTVVGTGISFTSSTLANGNVVTCILTPSGACATPATSTSNAITVTINPILTDSVTISGSANNICSGTAVTFTAQPFNGGTPSYQWFVSSASVGTGSTYTSSALANNNVVTCVMTPTGTCVSPATVTSNAITMVVSQNVTPQITISGSTSVCSGAADTITAQISGGGNAPTFAWTVGGSTAGTNSSILILPSVTTPGAIACTLTSSVACPSPASVVSNTINVAVNPTVTPTIQISTAHDSICQGATAVFAATVLGQGTTPIYQWYVNNTATATTAGFSSASLANGDSVSCILISNAACATVSQATSNAIRITMNPTPTATLVPSGSVVVCTGDSVLLTATGGTAYHWSTSAADTAIYASQAGAYTFTVTDVNGCTASPANPATISLHTPATPVITQAGNVLTVAPAAVSYQWVFGGATLGGVDTTQFITMTQSGSYLVHTVDASGCSATSTSYAFTATGISGVGADLGVRLYPVPNNGSFMIDMPEYVGAQLAIYDMYGHTIYQQSLSASHQEVRGLVLSPALYLVRIMSGSKVQTIKMEVKE